MAKKKPATGSIIEYVMKGPHAIEKRLLQLEAEFEATKHRLMNLALFRIKLKKKGWTLPSFIRKGISTAGSLGHRTLREIKAEQEALTSFIGKQMRAWETKESGPAPII